MPRSPSPSSTGHSSKRRKYDDDYDRDRRSSRSHYDDRDHNRDRSSRRSHRDEGSSRRSSRRYDDSPRSVDSGRDAQRSPRDRERERDRHSDRDRRRRDDDYREERSSRRHDDRSPRERDHSPRYERGSSRRERSLDPRDRDRDRTRERDRRALSPVVSAAPSTAAATNGASTPLTNGSGSAAASPAPAGPSAADEEKQRLKREKLEAWKRKKAAEAAASSSAAATPAAATPAGASPAPASPAPHAKAASPAPAPSFAPTPVLKKGPAGLPAKPVAAINASLPPKPLTASKPLPPSTSKPAGTPADASAAAAAAAAAIANRLSTLSAPSPSLVAKHALPASLPAKPAFSLGTAAAPRAAASGMKRSLGGEDDDSGRRMGMIKFDAADGDTDMGAPAAAQGGGEDDDDEDSDLDEEGAAYRARANAVRAARMAALTGAEEVKPAVEEDEEMDVDGEGGNAKKEDAAEHDDEEDELEAFMKGVQKQVRTVDKADAVKLGKAPALIEPVEPGEEEDVEEEDEFAKVGMSAQDILAAAAKKVKKGRELAAPDHSKIDYLPFRKAFYSAPPEVDALTQEEVDALRLELDDIKIRGAEPPKPATKWSYFGLPAACIDVIKSLEYAAPTSIQAQAIPAIMSGRDIIGVAKTGSGKTMAFILPMFRHIKDQPPLRPLDGPVAMIMTPTRELATQIYKECKPFLKALGLRASCAYGGMPLKDNIADMKRGSEVIVCTPGRMIELLTTNSGRLINLQRVTYLVLDEADRMFDMGFEPQVMKIIGQIRPDRQTVLFSATFPRQMEALARKVLRRPLEITVGGRSVVADTITQVVEVRTEETKFNRLLELLGKLFNDESDARALIFVERQESADKLFVELQNKNYTCMPLHGGREQVDRDQTIVDFKNGSCPIVIATSVAARGLDVKQLKLVVQYDVPNHMEDYVHRAGRTGRAGNTGTCVTFITPEQDRYSIDLVKALTASKTPVPAELDEMARAFADKVKAGKAQAAGSGFGGKGLERLDNDRDAASRAERAAYGETNKKEEKSGEDDAEEAEQAAKKVADLEVQIHRGPAPNLEKGKMIPSSMPAASAVDTKAADAAAKKAEQEALAAGKSAGAAGAASVLAKFNAMLKAKQHVAAPVQDHSTESARRRDPDATDYHAIVWINDYPQKARWKVTNKDTMVHLVETTGASITNKGIFYEPGKEPGPNDLPKLHLLIESNEEFRVQHAIAEIKKALIEGATMALEAEQRQQAGGSGGAAMGRYSVV
ncbi:pre-mRNA processing RNA-helicase [Rhodotorula kratochvilovae]